MTLDISAKINVTIPPGLRVLRIERVPCYDGFGWRIWLDANTNYSQGNFLLLGDQGEAEHVHVSTSYERSFNLVHGGEDDSEDR